MGKRKQKSDELQESDRVLGHDPFEGLDMEWLDREEGELSIQVLGHDPFEEMDVEWMDQEEVEPPVPPQPPEPLRVGLPTGVAPAITSLPEATFHFPADFKWGVATAAHQVEGRNTHNDWWAWEQVDGRIKQGHTSGLACDWWENAEVDFDRAAEMGLNAR